MKKFYHFLLVAIAVFSVMGSKAQTYCPAVHTIGCSSGDYIDLCTTTGGTTNINNPSSGCNGNPNNYIDYSSSQILTIAPGNTFNFTVQSGPSWSQGFRIWIDYNDNGSFYDPGEDVWNSGFSSTSAFTGSITVPITATGVTVMRVRCAFASVPTDPCSSLSYGETEDYGVVFCTIPPPPTVTTPVSGCVGATVTVNASASTGTINYYNVATGGTSQGTGTSYTTPVYTQAGPDTIWVAAENGGCSSTRIPIYVNVAAQTTVNLGPDTTVCGSIVLDAGYPGGTYLWSSGQGTQTLTVTNSGTYSVSLITAAGCTGSDNITVTVAQPPAYTLGNDTATCGSSVVIDAGSGFTSYAWSTGATTQTISLNSNDTVAVTVVDPNGCVLSDSIIVTLSPAPVVNLGPDITQCGGSATLNAGNPGAVYFWSNNTSSQTTSVSTSGTYSVNVITQAGCSDTDTINVTINNQPDADLGPDTSICLATVILDAGNPGSTYLWSTSAATQSITVGTGTYHVLVTDPSGCSDRDTISVTTNAPPVVSVSQDTSICPGGTATLTAFGAQTYLWSNNMTGATIPVSPTTNTAYYVTGTDANGCQASDVVIVSILPTASAQFTYSLTGVTASFNNQSTGAYSYSWNFGDATPVNTSANPEHTYTMNGTYTVTLTVTGACGTSTYTQVITITEVGISDNPVANTLSIYPNPNDGQFTIAFVSESVQDVTIEITDLAGRVVRTDAYEGVTAFNQKMDVSELTNGAYFVNVITQDGVVTKKIIVNQ